MEPLQRRVLPVNELQAALRDVDDLVDGSEPDTFKVIVEAARRWADIHPSRTHGWHILHIKPASWGLTHPLDCDLTNCDYQTQAESWDDPPDEIGNYRWEHEPVLESWMLDELLVAST